MSTDWNTLTPPEQSPVGDVVNPMSPVSEFPYNSPEWIAQRDAQLMKWQEAKDTLAAAKETEMSLRTEAARWVIPDDQRKSGMNNVELGNGYVAKVTHKINYNLVGLNADIEAVQDAIEGTGNEGAFLADRLITWKPDLSLTEYKALDMGNATHVAIKKLVDSVLETKPGTPTLEIKAPKA